MYLRRHLKWRRVGMEIFVVHAVFLVWFGTCYGRDFLERVKMNLALGLSHMAVEFFVPQTVYAQEQAGSGVCDDVITAVLPAMSYYNRILSYEAQSEDTEDTVTLAAEENAEAGEQAAEEASAGQDERSEIETMAEALASEKEAEESSAEAAELVRQMTIDRDQMEDFDYLKSTFYQVDSTTSITSDQLDASEMLKLDMTLQDAEEGEPQILIYHTHSQEGYRDSVEGDSSTTVVGVGEYLTELLTEQYGYQVLHHTGAYDVDDRDHAYTNAAPALEALLEEYPSIQIVIDLHRDGVSESTHLVTEINGKQTAQIMFFNGLSRTTALGDISWLPNPYIQENLAFSFQLQLAAAEYYPGLTRRIYLKGYRYNMHYVPQSLLVEVGAQTNTLEEAMNAMEPLAAILDYVLSGESRKE